MTSTGVAPSPPKILFLDHVGVLGGAEMVLIDMARHTRSRCHVILMDDGPLRESLNAVGAGVTVHVAPETISTVTRGSGLLHLARSIPHVVRLAWRIARHAKQFDVIWANSQKSLVIGSVAAMLAGRPLVWHLHDILTAEHFSAGNRKIAVILANLCACRVITVSNAGSHSFVEAGGRSDITAVLHNGINTDTFVPPNAASTRAEVEKELGLNGSSAPLVGVFGRLAPWKGQDVLIRALPSLPGVHAVLVGDALFNEDVYAESLRTLARDLGVADRTHFTGFRTDVARLMSAMDIIAHTSTSPEPFGRVIVEAMLARKPVIATAGGGVAEIVSRGRDGILVPPSNPTRLAEAIQNLLSYPSQASAMAARGYQTAVSNFTLNAFLNGVDQIAAEAAGQGEPDNAMPAVAEAIAGQRRTAIASR